MIVDGRFPPSAALAGIEKHRRCVLNDLLLNLTDGQRRKYDRIYGADGPTDAQLDDAVWLVERTVNDNRQR